MYFKNTGSMMVDDAIQTYNNLNGDGHVTLSNDSDGQPIAYAMSLAARAQLPGIEAGQGSPAGDLAPAGLPLSMGSFDFDCERHRLIA